MYKRASLFFHLLHFTVESARIKENGQMMSNSRGVLTKVADLLRHLKPGILTDLGVRVIGASGLKSHVQALRTETKELVVVIHSADISLPIISYKRRWDIGVSREGHINKSVKVRPGLKGSRPCSLGGTMARKQDGGALRQHFRKEGGQSFRL